MKLDVAALRALLDKATPGPWRAANGKGSGTVQATDCAVYINVDREVSHIKETVDRWQADAKLIAAMRNALPALLAVAEKAFALRDITLKAQGMATPVECNRQIVDNANAFRELFAAIDAARSGE